MSTTRNTASRDTEYRDTASGTRPRSFTARSVIASTLLGARPPALPVRVLVRSGALFGISEGTIRVALTRMVAAGDLVTDGDGRYELIGRLQRRQLRQDESRTPPAGDTWDGAWEQAIVVPEARPASERAELRAAMQRLRLAEVRDGTWMRPANLDPTRLPDDRDLVDGATHRLRANPDDPRGLAATLWDLDAWADDARRLADALSAAATRWRRHATVATPGALADAFVLEADVLRHLQHDPLLPAALTPDRWPGAQLRERFEAFDVAFLDRWRSWLRT